MSPSFAYVYEAAFSQGAAGKEAARIEAEVSRLGIQGPVLREGFHEVQEGLERAIQEGSKNVVFVGHHGWFLQWIPWISAQKGITIGFLPLEPSPLSRALGMPTGAAAVGILAARVLRVLDIGLINSRPFFTEAVVLQTSARLEFEGSYAVRAKTPGPLAIQNFALHPKTGEALSVPGDGQLEAVLHTPIERVSWFGVWKKTELEETRIAFTRGKLSNDGQPLQITVDGQLLTAKEFAFDVLPGAMSCVVGPERLFA